MKKIKKIWIDIDDTLYPFMEYLLPLLNKDFWKNVKMEDINSFDLLYLWEIDREEFKNKIKKYNIYETWEIYNETITLIKNLKKKNIQILFVTSRFQYNDYDTIKKTKQWLKKYNLDGIEIIFNNNKWNICKIHNIDIFVDDWLHNILDIIEKSKKTKTLILDQPWNRIAEFKKLKITHLFEKIDRIKNLNEIIKYIY